MSLNSPARNPYLTDRRRRRIVASRPYLLLLPEDALQRCFSLRFGRCV